MTSLQPEPARPAAGSKILFITDKGDGRFVEGTCGRRSAEEVHIHSPDATPSKFDIAGTCSIISRRSFAALCFRDDRCGDDACGSFREHTRFWCSDTCHVTDRIHTGKARLEILRIDRDPAVYSHAACRDHLRDAVLRDTEE